MILRKKYIDKIRPFIDKDLIKVLTGVRRSGKSVMLEQIQTELKESKNIIEKNIITYNFEQMKNAPLCNADELYKEIAKIVKNCEGKVYLFFDEIQEVDNWERCVNSFRADFDCDIYITGSNAKLLSGELATYLAGRYVEFVIYPFSFAEFVELWNSEKKQGELRDVFQSYIELGGMPYLGQLGFDKKSSQKYLTDIYNSVVLKDIIKRNSVRDVALLEKIIAFALGNVGNVFSGRSVAAFLKNERRHISVDTVLNYLHYCADACLLYQLSREEIGKGLLTTNEKYYVIDHGLREAVYGNNWRDINLVLENIVCIEMLRRGYKLSVGKIGDREIDFVGVQSGKKIYIQVAYMLASEETIEREFGIYKEVKDNYPKYVVSLDEIDMSRDGIKHCNIREFLLMEDW